MENPPMRISIILFEGDDNLFYFLKTLFIHERQEIEGEREAEAQAEAEAGSRQGAHAGLDRGPQGHPPAAGGAKPLGPGLPRRR